MKLKYSFIVYLIAVPVLIGTSCKKSARALTEGPKKETPVKGNESSCAISLLDGVFNSEPSGYFQVKNVKIIGNTIVNCAQGFDIGAGKGANNRTVPPANCVIANNVAQLKTGAFLIRFTDTPENFIYEGNIGFGMGAVSNLPTGFLVADPKLGLNEYMTYTTAGNSPVLGAFFGVYSFFQSADAGANKLDDLHKNYLRLKISAPCGLQDWAIS